MHQMRSLHAEIEEINEMVDELAAQAGPKEKGALRLLPKARSRNSLIAAKVGMRGRVRLLCSAPIFATACSFCHPSRCFVSLFFSAWHQPRFTCVLSCFFVCVCSYAPYHTES